MNNKNTQLHKGWASLRINVLSALSITFFALLSSPQAFSAEPIKVAFIASDIPPFKWEKDGKYQGSMIDVVKKAFEFSSLQYDLTPMPLARMMAEIKTGNRIDAAFGTFKRKSQEPYVYYFPTPIGYISIGLYINKTQDSRFPDIHSMKGHTFGVMTGHSLKPEIKQLAEDNKLKLVEVNKYKQLIDMLTLGRLDGFITPVLAVEEQKAASNPICLERIIRSNPLMFYFSRSALSKQPKSSIKKLERSFAQMNQEGLINTIYESNGISVSNQTSVPSETIFCSKST